MSIETVSVDALTVAAGGSLLAILLMGVLLIASMATIATSLSHVAQLLREAV
jgi:hypothetical protein